MQTHDDIVSALRLIFQGIGNLEAAFPHRKFTVDGRLVGDIGEVIAELEYGLTLDRVSAHTHDATAPDGRRVSIKATFKNSLTFTAVPDYMIGLQLLAFTGQGVFSYGTKDPYGASATDYIENALQNRSVTVTVLNTTPEQEQAMMDYYKKNYGRGSKYSIFGHSCANAAMDAMSAAGALSPDVMALFFGPDSSPVAPFLPSTVAAAAAAQRGGTTSFLPQASSVPPALGSFNQ